MQSDGGSARYELAGPETLSHAELWRLVMAAADRRRPLVPVPMPVTARALRLGEALLQSRTPVTWDEAELMEVPMTTRHGTADAEALGVVPKRVAAVLGG
jgi:uncharacterized protein YbjT (DUF2867 family)